MKTRHIFVPALDVGEFLPFCVRQSHKLSDQIKEQERAKKELERFIELLEKNFKEPIWYMGMDIIGERSYERFIFEKGGFFEVMTESPVALNAHFVHEERAKAFCSALRAAFADILPRSKITEMFIDSINVETQDDERLTVHKWHAMKNIRENE
jgi:lipoate-protein ligase A